MKMFLVLLLVGMAHGKDKHVDPAKFTDTVKVVEITSRTEAVSTRSTLPSYCSSPSTPFQKSYCAAAGNRSYVDNQRVTVMNVESGERVYQIEGDRLELGDYKVKLQSCAGVKGRCEPSIDFLMNDKNGKPVGVWYPIVGEKMKEKK